MAEHVVLVSIPGLREKDVAGMRNLRELMAGGEIAELTPSFPCVTCPVQINMTTGRLPHAHGIVANGLYWRERREVQMWTATNDRIERPQIWDFLSQHDPDLTSAAWFGRHLKQCEAEYVCTEAPVHNPDGSESLWCYTRPSSYYGTLQEQLGHFPLMHFWGPMSNIQSTAWIADSAVVAARELAPRFFYIYLPHLDYAAQRTGPDSPAAQQAIAELDEVLGRLAEGFRAACGDKLLWLAAGEYVIVPVDRVTYPNRVLREAGLLKVIETVQGEELDLAGSQAWALVDHQFSHVFVDHGDPAVIARVADVFRQQPDIAEVLVGDDLARYGLHHPRSGELVLISAPNSWQAYYWWLSDDRAPAYARTVDIHRKPGYDPVELCFDPATRSIPLDTRLIHGSHGAPATDSSQKTVLLASQPGLFPDSPLADTDVFHIVLRQFGADVE